MVSKDIIDTILKKFLTQRRMPDYSELTEEQKYAEYDKERNKIIYSSSAFWMDHWSYTKCLDSWKFMLTPNKSDFICALPYQLSIKEGLLDKNVVEDEMAESDFSEIKFSINYSVLIKPIEPVYRQGVHLSFRSHSKWWLKDVLTGEA